MDSRYVDAGYIDKEFAKRHLKANLDHFKYVASLPKEVLSTRMGCEEEIKGIELLLNSDDVLDKYVEAWNEAITALHDVQRAASEYGKTAESLFGIYYWG